MKIFDNVDGDNILQYIIPKDLKDFGLITSLIYGIGTFLKFFAHKRT